MSFLRAPSSGPGPLTMGRGPTLGVYTNIIIRPLYGSGTTGPGHGPCSCASDGGRCYQATRGPQGPLVFSSVTGLNAKSMFCFSCTLTYVVDLVWSNR